MAIHGKDAIIYLSPGSGAAVEVTEQNLYSIESDFDLSESTELGDGWKTNVRGTSAWSGKLDGNFDIASQALWLASQSSSPNNFYLYPRRGTAGQYYYGTCWVKLGTAIAGGVSDKAKTSVSLIGDGALSVN